MEKAMTPHFHFKNGKNMILTEEGYLRYFGISALPTKTKSLSLLKGFFKVKGLQILLFLSDMPKKDEKNLLRTLYGETKGKGFLDDSIEVLKNQEKEALLTEALKNKESTGEPLYSFFLLCRLMAKDEKELSHRTENFYAMCIAKNFETECLYLLQKEAHQSFIHGCLHEKLRKKVLYATSGAVANLYPMNFPFRRDFGGMLLGECEDGIPFLFSPFQQDDEHVNTHALLIGNSGTGKSHLLKHLCTHAALSGKRLRLLDPENEYTGLLECLGGKECPVSFSEGFHNACVPFFIGKRLLTRIDYEEHAMFLASLLTLNDDCTPVMLAEWGKKMMRFYDMWQPYEKEIPIKNMPTLRDMAAFFEKEQDQNNEAFLSRLSLLIPKNGDSFFTTKKILSSDDRPLSFPCKSLFELPKKTRTQILYFLLTYLKAEMLEMGDTVAVLDECYLFFQNHTCMELLRDIIKRSRKCRSSLFCATQTTEDFTQSAYRDYALSLLSIPENVFLFHMGNGESQHMTDIFHLTPKEQTALTELKRGECLLKSGKNSFRIHIREDDFTKELVKES